ncbi:ComEA family DNA-binding protein [Streptomyces avermitilis]|uniref:ComEA family DNA-binding protein n=1 Tax=Streptomyces avermitilis TaxID=33903 RepID=UPI00382F06FA
MESVRSTRLRAPGVDLEAAAEGLGRFYESQNMTVQTMPVGGAQVVQARSSSQWKRALGMAVALTVTLRQDGVDLVIEIGGAPWMAKSTAAVFWSAALPPMMLAPVVGLANQARMPRQTIDFLKATLPNYLRDQSPPAPAASAVPPVQHRIERVEVNTAAFEQLAALPQLGPDGAAEVVRLRMSLGGFRSIDHFATTLGNRLPPDALERLLRLVTVERPPPPRPTYPPPTAPPGATGHEPGRQL